MLAATLSLRSCVRWIYSLLALGVMSCGLGLLCMRPSEYRMLIALSVGVVLIGLSIRNKSIPMIFLLLYLPVMSLIRRILIPVAGWNGNDPLLLLTPIVILLLGSYQFYHVYVLRDEVFDESRLFRFVRWLLLISLLEVANPKQGGLSVGLGGILYYVVPLFWMVLARRAFTPKHLSIVCKLTVVWSIGIALYGLKQTFYGYYPFETEWMQISGYVALNVNGAVRAISTLASAQEYAQYLAGAIVIGWVWVLRGRWWTKLMGVLVVCFLGYSLFMISARGPVVTTATAVAVVTILNARRPKVRVVTAIVVICVLTGLFVGLSHIHSSSALVQHQVAGLTNVQNSSASGHASRMFDGIGMGIKTPIGYGLGSTTMAARFGGTDIGTEVDISNIFVSNGILGGTVFLLIILVTLVRGVIRCLHNDTLALIALGFLIANLGQWLNGSLYSTAALVWVMVAYIDNAFAIRTGARINRQTVDIRSHVLRSVIPKPHIPRR